jgi:cytidyltransferase-like protein
MSNVIKVMGFGTFDTIHAGHMDFFKQLRELGDKVYVVVSRDKNVERIKCKPPKRKERERFEALKKLKLVDRVLMGNKDDFYKCIKDNKPDVIGLGYDQKADVNYLKRAFPYIKVVRLKPFKPGKYKTSILENLKT